MATRAIPPGLDGVATGTGGATVAVPAVATATAVLDTATTAVIVTSPSYVELNLLLASLAAIHPAVAIAGFAAFNLGLISVAWLGRGRFSTVVGLYLIGTTGAGGLNNLVLFATGTAPLDLLGGVVAVNLAVPALGAGLALAGAQLLHCPSSWPRVVPAGATFAVAIAVLSVAMA